MICRRLVPQHSTVFQSLWFCSVPSTSHAKSQKYNKTISEGIVHVTSLNVLTEAKSIVQLEAALNRQPRKFRREFKVPEQAVSGLRSALISCERSPGQVQHEADQLNEQLLQRRFPAPPSVVREARNKVKLMLKEKEQQTMCDLLSEDLQTTGINYRIRNEVDKILKAQFNWRPLFIETKEAAAAYALSRFAPNYAEIARVLDEFEGNSFCPENVLDYGCGIGAGFWAVNERYGSAVKDYCMVDPSVAMTKFAMDIMRADNGGLLHRSVNFRRHLISPREKYDLVIVHRTLCELDSRESRLELISSLWKRTKRFLLLIDSGSNEAFEALMEARDFLLLSGTQLHMEDTISLLKEHNLMTDNIRTILHDDTITNFERFFTIRDLVPAEVVLPTALPPAMVYAPCPHDLGCPKLTCKSSCTFPVRWRVIRADGKRSPREISGVENGRFSFVILEKCLRHLEESFARILKIRQSDGHVTCDLCTSFNGIQRMTVSRRAGALYQQVRGRKDGELFPLRMKTSKSSFDSCDLFSMTTELI